MRDLTAAIQAAATQSGTRQTIGEGVSWGALPVPTLWPSMVDQQSSNAISFYVTTVTPGAGGTALVAARAAKTVGATVATSAKTIEKHGLQATLSLEDFEQSEAAIAAVLSTLIAGCTVSQEGSAYAALDASAAASTPAASWVAAIAGGQAAIASKGGTPSLVVVPAASWAALATEIAASPGLVTPSTDAIINVLGSRVAISPNGAGESFVVDPSAVVTVLRDVGVFVSPIPATNEILCVADVVASTFVARPNGVVAISKGP